MISPSHLLGADEDMPFAWFGLKMKPDSPHIRALVKRMEMRVQQGPEPTKSLQNFPETVAVTRMLSICSCEKHPYTSDLQKFLGVWGYNSLMNVY